jgi:GalNAc-alpha-(1->4)-GalNAc-alpha-(1->3)-diNAcBac-PP-undecaprenol alpha-1,4-N-acetyl-D-galactosaminyltransferase
MRSVAFIIPNLQMGGAENAMVTLANEWVQTADISIITFDEGTTFFKLDNRIKIVPLHTTGTKGGFLYPLINVVKRYYRLPRAVKKIKPDITIPFMDTSIMWAFFSRFFTRVPLMMVFQLTPSKAIMQRIFFPLRKILYKKAQAAVVLTNDTIDVFERLNIKLPAKTFVIPNALSTDIVFKEPVQREDVILGLGRLADQKQFNVLIKMFNQLQPTHWQLWIVGEGEKRKELEDLIENYGLQNKVKLWGAQKNVGEFYSRAKIFAMTSYYEGFCVALCEAMANGCACVSFDCEVGPADSIENNVNGLLIEDQNQGNFLAALQQLINSPADINRLSGNARSIIDKLNIGKIVNKWEAAVKETLEK